MSIENQNSLEKITSRISQLAPNLEPQTRLTTLGPYFRRSHTLEWRQFINECTTSELGLIQGALNSAVRAQIGFIETLRLLNLEEEHIRNVGPKKKAILVALQTTQSPT